MKITVELDLKPEMIGDIKKALADHGGLESLKNEFIDSTLEEFEEFLSGPPRVVIDAPELDFPPPPETQGSPSSLPNGLGAAGES